MFKRLFSSTTAVRSHIGSSPVYLTPETKFSLTKLPKPIVIRKGKDSLKLSQVVTVSGPKGELSFQAPNFVKIENVDGKLNVSVPDPSNKTQRSMWGTVRSLLNNNVTGVTEGHLTMLKLVGTGYRAQLDPSTNFLSMKVGASIMQGLYVPEGITVTSPVPTRVIIEGINKQQVMLFAANLRKFHPPEPYKGKGIYIDDETIKLKDKKIK